MKACSLLIPVAAVCIQTATAKTIVVNSTADGGANDDECTLREAITAANTNTASGGKPGECVAGAAGFDTINFNIPGSGVRTITPATPLPTITQPIVIDGYTQPGAKPNTRAIGNDAVLRIELNGNGTIAGGLTISAGASTVRGLVINRFDGNGITLQSAGGNTVEGNWIGLSASGTALLKNNGRDIFISDSLNNLIGGTSPAARNVLVGSNSNGSLTLFSGAGATIQGNYVGMNAQGTNGLDAPGGISIGTSGNVIGGTAPGARNVISGAGLDIGIGVAQSKNNIVQGNTFGLNANGTAALANNTRGVRINITPTNQADGNLIGGTATGARNVFATSGTAVDISGADAATGGNTVQGNYIGLNVAGTAAPVVGGSTRRGVLIGDSNNHLIGGTAAGAGNVIASYTSGVEIYGSGNVVQGNLIGTNAAGTVALGNGTGVLLTNNNLSGDNNTIGGSAPGAGNLISGNTGHGVSITVGDGNLIQGNRIGTNRNGTGALGNDGYGIALSTTSSNNTIGGTIAGAGNVIAFNGSEGRSSGGVGVLDGTGNSILGNSIFSNTGLGINLSGGAGTGDVTLNDTGDPDTGPNNLQNYPVLKSITRTGGNVNITGTLNSAATTSFRIEFFRNDAIDPAGFGEGENFLGFTNVTTNGSGNASFNVTFPSTPERQRITATATDPSGNTSEFSPSLGQLLNISTRLRVQTGDNVLIAGFIVTGVDPKKVIARALGPSLPSDVPDRLQNPTLELHDKNGVLAFNDDWKDSQEAAIKATGIPPPENAESAIVRTLPAGAAGYTAVVHGKGDSTGTAVVEVYDLDQGAESQLANISTRGLVEGGNNLLIGGFIAGNGVTRVIVRALGPSLAGSVSQPLPDPLLELHDGNGGVLATNDNWRDDQEAEIMETQIPPPNNVESAIVATLPPGGYTAVVRDVNSAIGVALVEVYSLN